MSERPLIPLKQILGGALLLTLGTGCTIYFWYLALVKGAYYFKAGVLFPIVGLVGLVVMFMGDLEAVPEDQLRNLGAWERLKLIWKLQTTPHKFAFGCCIGAGIVNVILMKISFYMH